MADMNSVNYRSSVICISCIIATVIMASLICFGSKSLAVIVPAFDIDKMLKDSDLVAVVKPTAPLGKVRVIAIYSGELISQEDFIDITTDNPKVISALKTKRDICVFLKKAEKSKTAFSLTSKFYPFFHVVPERPSGNITGKAAIELELLQGLTSSYPMIVEDSVLWLKRLKSAKGKEEIMRLAEKKSAPTPIRAFAFEMKIPQGEKQVIEDALAFLEETVEYKGRTMWRFHVVWAFSEIKATTDVQFLNELLVKGPAEVARALSFSSREWANATSIPFLIRALQRLDNSGKYRCIIALHKLTRRGLPGPAKREFMADPSKYILDWQKWWAAGELATPPVPVGPKPIQRKETFGTWPSLLIGAVAGVFIAKGLDK